MNLAAVRDLIENKGYIVAQTSSDSSLPILHSFTLVKKSNGDTNTFSTEDLEVINYLLSI